VGENPAPSGADLLAARLRVLVARVGELDAHLRTDDAASVHELRLAVRRLRSTLASYSPVFEEARTADVRRELRWFGSLLGEVRDQEVMVQQVELLDDRGTAVLLAELRGRHASAQDRLSEALVSPRYAELVESLHALAAEPPFTDLALMPARDLVRIQGRRDWRRIRGRVDTLPAPDDATYEEHLHDVRKAAKRLRYLLETARPVTQAESRSLRRRLASFQRRLGEHHDASLTGRLLVRAGHPAQRAQAEADAVAAEFPELWRRLSRSRLRRWLR
jgi:CHAD domain-containing protein